ncbi:MAG: H/ACA RNA-protein complex component Gar1 [Euryarchaeota archaeon]|nr:H/ACA RNA-protein complex component Gar1 [Euryarchaeota archaeon]
MESLGVVHKVTREGAIVIRSSVRARIGARVVDNKHMEVGRIQELIGPVKAPYVVVSPKGSVQLHRLQGRELFVR